MDEVPARQSRGMDAARFEDCHAVLHPQQGTLRVDLGKKKPRPAAVAGMHCEELRESGAERNRQAPAITKLVRELAIVDRAACAAGDQDKACSHTTHNVFVLRLFFFPRLAGRSQWCDSPALYEPISSRNLHTSRTTSRDARLEMAKAM